ncbi:MAG: putative Ig domain-containing protein [Mangrovibacterium sp.]
MNKISHCSILLLIAVLGYFCPIQLFSQNAEGGPAVSERLMLTPKPKPQPRINGPLVYGARPGHPFLYRIPCQGERPLRFSVKGLPTGLILDQNTGIISGKTPSQGKYSLMITAKNAKGKATREFTIVSGAKLALTPPMGWNHWYAHYDRVTDQMMREAADILISSGMADVGYQYVNIDDCWMNSPKHNDPKRVGPLRDEQGNMIPNSYFPDMNALTDYIHSKGLKAGIYTSPGPLTCGKFAGSYQHEKQDARQFAAWGFDFLKYDWCSYGGIAKNPDDRRIPDPVNGKPTLEGYQYPYRLMGEILKEQNRDIVFNLCQYGMGEVWKWGAAVGGHCWRTSGDLGFELDRIFEVALKNSEYRQYSKPGEWNDPDYLQIGYIGNARKMGIPELTPMSADLQYAYMSLWCLMAAPLIYSGDMSRLDEFTINVLCNPEVIEIDQDPLGEGAVVIKQNEELFLMVKNLVDGSKAVGMFNRGNKESEMTFDFSEVRLNGKYLVRDLWRQKNLGRFSRKFTATVPAKGVILIKISK